MDRPTGGAGEQQEDIKKYKTLLCSGTEKWGEYITLVSAKTLPKRTALDTKAIFRQI